MLTTFDLDEYVYEALRAGASGFLLKDTPPAELLAAIRVVAAGEALLAPSVTRRLIAEFAAAPRAAPAGSPASSAASPTREREVLAAHRRAACPTPRSPNICTSAPAPSKTHVGRLLAKLGARDRAQLVIFAYETGLVSAAR